MGSSLNVLRNDRQISHSNRDRYNDENIFFQYRYYLVIIIIIKYYLVDGL